MPGFNLELVQKIKLIDKVFLLTFVVDEPLEARPGQYVSLETQPKVHRAYSIAHLSSQPPFFTLKHGQLPELKPSQKYLSLIISTKPAGPGSEYFEQIKVGNTTHGLAISGRFRVIESELPKFFICTGTGLAPFVPMINQVFEQNPEAEVKLFFGTTNRSFDFSRQFFSDDLLNKPNFQIYTCIDEEKFLEDDRTFMGRVTEVVPRFVTDLQATEFYLCGNPIMVQAMEQKLKDLEVPKPLTIKEAYGSVRQSK
jgi:Na+-transporting NADH:ubiquinone oxidoreductase subunit F